MLLNVPVTWVSSVLTILCRMRMSAYLRQKHIIVIAPHNCNCLSRIITFDAAELLNAARIRLVGAVRPVSHIGLYQG